MGSNVTPLLVVATTANVAHHKPFASDNAAVFSSDRRHERRTDYTAVRYEAGIPEDTGFVTNVAAYICVYVPSLALTAPDGSSPLENDFFQSRTWATFIKASSAGE